MLASSKHLTVESMQVANVCFGSKAAIALVAEMGGKRTLRSGRHSCSQEFEGRLDAAADFSSAVLASVVGWVLAIRMRRSWLFTLSVLLLLVPMTLYAAIVVGCYFEPSCL